MTDSERNELDELRRVRKNAAALGVDLTPSARELELEHKAEAELADTAGELGIELEGKRPEPFVDDDGVELVTERGELTLEGAARLLGENLVDGEPTDEAELGIDRAVRDLHERANSDRRGRRLAGGFAAIVTALALVAPATASSSSAPEPCNRVYKAPPVLGHDFLGHPYYAQPVGIGYVRCLRSNPCTLESPCTSSARKAREVAR